MKNKWIKEDARNWRMQSCIGFNYAITKWNGNEGNYRLFIMWLENHNEAVIDTVLTLKEAKFTCEMHEKAIVNALDEKFKQGHAEGRCSCGQ